MPVVPELRSCGRRIVSSRVARVVLHYNCAGGRIERKGRLCVPIGVGHPAHKPGNGTSTVGGTERITSERKSETAGLGEWGLVKRKEVLLSRTGLDTISFSKVLHIELGETQN